MQHYMFLLPLHESSNGLRNMSPIYKHIYIRRNLGNGFPKLNKNVVETIESLCNDASPEGDDPTLFHSLPARTQFKTKRAKGR